MQVSARGEKYVVTKTSCELADTDRKPREMHSVYTKRTSNKECSTYDAAPVSFEITKGW